VQDKETGDRRDRTRLPCSLPSGKSRSLDNRISARFILAYPIPLTGIPERGSVVHRAHYCYYCITPLPPLRPPNNRAATHSSPSAPWCHRNAHLHSEAQPCANETARLQLLTRPYEDHHYYRAGTTKHLCRKNFFHSLHAYHRLHPTSLDRSRHLMKVRNQTSQPSCLTTLVESRYPYPVWAFTFQYPTLREPLHAHRLLQLQQNLHPKN
jgi:hypothetical protein